MTCEAVQFGFTGTVVECTTKYRSTAQTAIPVDRIMANWIEIVDVEQADEGAPRPAGARVAFMFHSPTHVFFESAEEVVGGRFRFTVERAADGTRWQNLRGQRLQPA
jgi:hypothetical protein